MKFFPESALSQLEFDKVKELLIAHCRNEYAKNKAEKLRIHTRKEFIDKELQETHEFKTILDSGDYFPNDFPLNISKELKLLSLPGAVLSGEQFLLVKKLSDNTENIFRWFNQERRDMHPAMALVIEGTYFEKQIKNLIDEVLDEYGNVKDNASEELIRIRMSLYRKRAELRKVFDRLAGKLNKLGYLSDIEESFMNGRRVLAVFAEQKRMVKGILHAESDSRRTSFIEPEETTELNNQVFSLENEESKEVYRILRKLTADLSFYSELLGTYYKISGEYDFVRAKARLAQDMGAQLPFINDKICLKLINAYHPLLLLYNKKQNKETIPLQLQLDANNRILVVSGPNAGGKTVTLKTVGLLQLMMQSGLLIPVSADSEMGIFKQIMIHIGDTQSIEFELSTYSSHLRHMKHFIENANGKTLFFIDELGSGSDPNLGGAFAEVIMEELAVKHAFGIVTTHYLNLKVMANKVAGVINGAMQFDEKNLLPLYKLKVGSPGSSYTFSIAERIGLNKNLIQRARKLVDENHFKLDKLLNSTEQDLQKIEKEKKHLNHLLKENEKLKHEMQNLIDRESHRQEMERLKLENKIAEEKFAYMKDMERKLKSMVIEWRKTEDKASVVKMIQALLLGSKDKIKNERQQKKFEEKFEEISGEIAIGAKVKMRQNRQVGTVKELRGKKALLQVGIMPMLVDIKDLVVVKDKPEPKI
jgi:DNA mismatch repair protein MutS2